VIALLKYYNKCDRKTRQKAAIRLSDSYHLEIWWTKKRPDTFHDQMCVVSLTLTYYNMSVKKQQRR